MHQKNYKNKSSSNSKSSNLYQSLTWLFQLEKISTFFSAFFFMQVLCYHKSWITLERLNYSTQYANKGYSMLKHKFVHRSTENESEMYQVQDKAEGTVHHKLVLWRYTSANDELAIWGSLLLALTCKTTKKNKVRWPPDLGQKAVNVLWCKNNHYFTVWDGSQGVILKLPRKIKVILGRQ